MNAFVFTDGALARHAGRFVWLSIDTENQKNAAFVEQFPIEAYPSFFIIDPKTQKPALRWLGSMTVAQVERLLEDGERAVKGAAAGLDQKLAEADRAYGEGDLERAATLLTALLAQAPADWRSRPRAVETALYALSGRDQNEPCLALARAELPRLGRTPSYANAAAVGLNCALGLPADAPGRAEAVGELEKTVREAVASDIQMAADDRSGMYEALAGAREDAADAAGVKQVASQWAAFLEAEAQRAKTAEQRAVFDAHRMTAYLMLGEPERAVPMLQASERDLPQDYNPPVRLARVYRELGKHAEALAAVDRGLAKAYGPRKLRAYAERAEIQAAMGDAPGAVKTLEQGLAHVQTLTPKQRSKRTLETFEKRIGELRATGAPDAGAAGSTPRRDAGGR